MKKYIIFLPLCISIGICAFRKDNRILSFDRSHLTTRNILLASSYSTSNLRCSGKSEPCKIDLRLIDSVKIFSEVEFLKYLKRLPNDSIRVVAVQDITVSWKN